MVQDVGPWICFPETIHEFYAHLAEVIFFLSFYVYFPIIISTGKICMCISVIFNLAIQIATLLTVFQVGLQLGGVLWLWSRCLR